ncbi:Telomere-reg-2 domain-containing protein [Mycena kentingensis (nom. inval.)]|nr:Telomere-reg-2 domain-containing protein [Mycena kentingensis (nom. inval.)]
MVEDIIAQLQAQVSDADTLLTLLAAPLACISLLPPQLAHYNKNPLSPNAVDIQRHIPSFQREILQHLAPTWESVLAEKQATALLEQYLCPDLFSFASPEAGEVTLLAYSTILSLPLADYSLKILVRLSERYPVDRLHAAVFGRAIHDAKRVRRWEDCVRNIAAVPARVSNALQGRNVPPALEHGTYFNNVCKRTDCAISLLSASPREHELSSLAFLLTKLVNVGVFPPAPPSSPAQPSFFVAAGPQIRVRLTESNAAAYSSSWRMILQNIPSSLTVQSIVCSLFATLSVDSGISDTPHARAVIKREARLLQGILAASDAEDIWDSISSVILSREWTQAHARIFACWVSQFADNHSGKSLQRIWMGKLSLYSPRTLVRSSCGVVGLARARKALIIEPSPLCDITSLLLVTLSYFPPSSPQLESLALSPALISGVGRYISHLDDSVRRCGMLVAELVASMTEKKLDFGDWDGVAGGRIWARQIRTLLTARDSDALDEPDPPAMDDEVPPSPVIKSDNLPSRPIEAGYDSDDSLSGYVSQSTSRSASPTPSELEEIEKDPTLGVGAKKVSRPVYLSQLGALIRPAGGTNVNENDLAAEMEVGLNCAEELIRRKRGYGTELDENAVNLVYGLVAAQNNYDLDGFSQKRQGALSALVACAPRVASPAIIGEFFKNQYSTDQRFAMLNALALGARELASLTIPKSSVPLNRIAFPSKTLPARQHQKYLEDTPLPRLLEDISREALDRDVQSTADKVPEFVRERRLRVQKPAPLQEIQRQQRPTPPSLPKSTTFTEVAAQYFIGPLVNHFWLFFRDEQTREQRTAHLEGPGRYHGAGTGLILNAIVLSHLLATLAILAHASRNAPEWLAVIAPELLELAVTMGTKPISHDDDPEDVTEPQSKEASVLCAALELALVVLDGCLELDGGRALGLDHTALLFGTGEWAGSVFAKLDKGLLVEGGGGIQEVKLKRAAAGVLLKVDTLTSKWRRSMIDI